MTTNEGAAGSGAPRFRVHPLDLLLLLLACGLGALAFAKLFRESPLPLPSDRLLGAELEVEFAEDRPWKGGFGPVKGRLQIEDSLFSEVVERSAAPGDRVRMRLRVLGRDLQRPDELTHFRRILRRGASITLSEEDAEVEAEVLSIREPGEKP
jgi:hypothetical protein